MSKAIESNIDEEINSAGDGSGVALPPAFVIVQPRVHRRMKKNNGDNVDGRTSGAKALFTRIQKRKMKEQVEEKIIPEAVSSETERAQKQIAQKKKLGRSKDLQKKRKEAKEKMQSKTKEMDILMKARMSDFKKKAQDQTKKLKRDHVEPTGDTISEGQDVVQVALDVATSELSNSPESFAKIEFSNGTTQNLDNFSAKRIAAVYGQLDDTHKQQFQYMLNKDAGTYQSALDFAIRHV
tara:strand:+ start:312 stop:1025 length:714 start_codon:yes stop_codon:yes gene_type:complete